MELDEGVVWTGGGHGTEPLQFARATLGRRECGEFNHSWFPARVALARGAELLILVEPLASLLVPSQLH